MNRERKILSEGKDHSDMLSIFRSLVVKSGAKKGDSLVWAGCPGPCYSMATFFSYGLRDLGLDLFFATDADINRLWRFELEKELGNSGCEKGERTQSQDPHPYVRASDGSF